jgi:type III secretion protein L
MLLKASDASAQSAVRPLGISMPEEEGLTFKLPSLPGAKTIDQPREDERSELEATIAALHQRLADAQSEADAREDAAFERGRHEGEDIATGETEKRLESLRKGLEALRQGHLDRLAEYELLTLQLARTALARLFGDESLHAELVAATVANQFVTAKRELVLGLRVSPRDFRSEEELRALVEHFPGLEIAQDETLEPGGCMLDLRLGTIDLGLPGQWQRLTAFFERLASGEAEA